MSTDDADVARLAMLQQFSERRAARDAVGEQAAISDELVKRIASELIHRSSTPIHYNQAVEYARIAVDVITR